MLSPMNQSCTGEGRPHPLSIKNARDCEKRYFSNEIEMFPDVVNMKNEEMQYRIAYLSIARAKSICPYYPLKIHVFHCRPHHKTVQARKQRIA